MYSKKQRIISFLIAFLLIFTFAFINPLTSSKSEAFVFAPVLTTNMSRIITGVLVSAGYIIHEGVTSTVDYDIALQNMSRVIYQTLDGAQKLLLGALSLIDNIVEVPVSLYNSIVNKANSVLRMEETQETLVEQEIGIKYLNYSSTKTTYPKITVPYYTYGKYLNQGTYTYRVVDVREAQPYFVYKGIDNASENIFYTEGVDYFYTNVFSEDEPVLTFDTSIKTIFLTPDLSSYNILYSSTSSSLKVISECLSYEGLSYRQVTKEGSNYYDSYLFDLNQNDLIINDLNVYSYFVKDLNGRLKSVIDIYDKSTGEFLQQVIFEPSYTNGIGLQVFQNQGKDVPYDYDITFEPDTTTTIVPPVTNTAGDNVITLPSELSGTIGATSSDVNIQTGTGEGGTNTETMENINTNVGELVTGGELGEQVNTNIGTVEGLHGEITSQVDFEAVFDTIAQYISALDISSVTWFPVAVASFLVPFLPVISLGIILFFIDRVLNGGA